MYANFIYFIIVLLIYTTYQPSEETPFDGINTFLLFIGLILFFATVTRQSFKALERRFGYETLKGLDHRYHTLLTRQSALAIGLFAVDIYGLSLPSFFTEIKLFVAVPTLQALLFLALFIFYLSIVWYYSHGTYQRLFGSRIPRRSYVWTQISISVPVLLPWLMLSGVSDLIHALPFELPKQLLATTEGQIIYFLFFLLLVTMIGPAFIQKFWQCTPLEDGAMRSRIEAVCRKAEMDYANILYWPIFGGRMITAGVMGLIKKFRYILVTNALLNYLEPEEIDAVIAHEIGHVKRKHLLFYLLFFIGYMLISFATFDLIVYVIIYTEPMLDIFNRFGVDQVTMTSIVFSLIIIFLFLIYFRYIFGYFMRNFERQADGYVYNLFESARPLITTLEKIALTTGQSPDRPNWHHYSIKERIDYLEACEQDRSTLARHDRKIKKSMAIYLVAMVMVGFIGYNLNFGETGKKLGYRFFERIIQREIEKNPEDANLYQVLGDLYYNTGNFTGVRDAYEKSLALNGDNPHVLNNLAWLYATSEIEDLRDPERALMLARYADILKKEVHIKDTLAEAYFVNGMYIEAIEIGSQALKMARSNRTYYEKQLEKFKEALAQAEGEQLD